MIIDILPTVEVIMVVVVVLVVVAVLVVVVLVLVVVVVVLVVAVVTEFIVAEIVEVAVVVVEIIVAMFVVNTGLFSLVVVSLVELQACTIGAVVNVKAMRSTIPLLDIIILNDALVTNQYNEKKSLDCSSVSQIESLYHQKSTKNVKTLY